MKFLRGLVCIFTIIFMMGASSMSTCSAMKTGGGSGKTFFKRESLDMREYLVNSVESAADAYNDIGDNEDVCIVNVRVMRNLRASFFFYGPNYLYIEFFRGGKKFGHVTYINNVLTEEVGIGNYIEDFKEDFLIKDMPLTPKKLLYFYCLTNGKLFKKIDFRIGN